MQAILRQTGKSRLQAGLTEEEQYRKLMDAGLTVMKSKSMTLGQGLTESEQQQLTEDVVMLVSQPVVLPNGKTETLLVPTLYLAPTTQRVEGAANMQAQSINLQVGTMHNRGSIVADDAITVHGNTIHNDNGLIKGRTTTVVADTDVRNTQGTIEGRDHTTVYAKNDVINEGGTIKQTDETGKLVVAADRDVINNGVKYEASNSKVVWDSANSRRETVTAVDQGQIAAKGDAVVTAGRDVAMQAGTVTSGKDATVAAGRQVTMKAMTENHELEEHRYDKGKSGGGHSQTTETHDVVNEATSVGSSVEGNNVTVSAKADVALSGSEILAADKAQVEGQNVKLDTASATSTANHVYKDKKKSLVKRERTDATGVTQVTAVTGSVVSGKDVDIKANKALTGKSVTVIGKNSVSLQANDSVALGADKHIIESISSYHHKKSGLLGGAGIGFSIGTEKLNTDDLNRKEVTAYNTIASPEGTVDVQSNHQLHITSGNILSKDGIQLTGDEVILDGNHDASHMSHNESYKKSGLTVSLGGAAIDAVTTATRTIKRAGSRDDKRLAALELNEARKQLQDGYYAVDEAVKGAKLRNDNGAVLKDTKGHSLRDQKNIDNAVNLSVSLGSTSRHQNQSVDTSEYKGGTIISNSDVKVRATDASKSGVNLTGQDVLAKKIVIDSASDVNLTAGQDTLHAHDDYKQSGWSVGANFSLTSGSLLGFEASGNLAKQNGVTEQISYKPTSIRATELAQLKAKRDTTIIGSTVSGKGVTVDTGNNLQIESLQAVDNFKEHSKSGGFSVSSSPKFKDTLGSIGASVGRMDSKWRSVTEQAGIYAGADGYTVKAGNETKLKGAVVSSKAPKNQNTLATRRFTVEDIQNEAEYTVRENGVQYNNFGNIKSKSKKELDKIYKHLGTTPTGGIGAHDKATSTTKSAISEGIIKENGRIIDVKTVNTDIEHSLNTLEAIFDRKSIEEKQELANLFSINANEAIHQIAKHEGWKEGDPRKVALHTFFAGTAAKLGGNKFSDGAYAGGLTEAMMPQFEKWAGTITGPDGKKYVNSERLQQIAGVFGYVVNKSFGKNGQSGAYVARMGAKYNEGFELPESIDNTLQVFKRRLFEPKGDGPSYQFPDKPDEEPLTLQDRANILGGIGGYSQEQVDEAYAQQEAYSNEIAETVQAAMTNSEPGNEENYAIPYTPSVAEQVTGGETEATQAYNVAMNEINNPTDVSTESINRGIAVGGGVASSLFIGRALHHEGMEMVDKVVSKERVKSLVKPLAKSATKAVAMEVGGLAGDAAFTGINMNQNRIDFEGRPDLIEKADKLDETSLAIGATGSVATLGVGAVNVFGGTVVGGTFVTINTGYGVYAEYEKDELREEYKRWKDKGIK